MLKNLFFSFAILIGIMISDTDLSKSQNCPEGWNETTYTIPLPEHPECSVSITYCYTCQSVGPHRNFNVENISWIISGGCTDAPDFSWILERIINHTSDICEIQTCEECPPPLEEWDNYPLNTIKIPFCYRNVYWTEVENDNLQHFVEAVNCDTNTYCQISFRVCRDTSGGPYPYVCSFDCSAIQFGNPECLGQIPPDSSFWHNVQWPLFPEKDSTYCWAFIDSCGCGQ